MFSKRVAPNLFRSIGAFTWLGFQVEDGRQLCTQRSIQELACSVSIAGTLPLYLRFNGSVGDQEQFEPKFYQLAGYPDLYLLAANGKGRSHIQILNRRDDCCFGEAQHDPKLGTLI